LITRAIGYSEGNRTLDAKFRPSYYGHRDPGNGAHNLGSFSRQESDNVTPEAADQDWLNRLRDQMPRYLKAVRSSGLDPNDLRLLLNFCDLYTQAPLAAIGEGGFLDQMPAISRQGTTTQAILEARMQAYVDPQTGRLDAPGFANQVDRLQADQKRRMAALEDVLSNYNNTPAKGNYMRLVRTGTTDEYGALLLRLEYVSGDGQIQDQVQAVSGAPGKQALRTIDQSMSGSNEPVPEGWYLVGQLEWSQLERNQDSWGEGLGPMWIQVYDTGNRSDIGIHLDANRKVAPGTAGCIGLIHPDDLQKVADWYSRQGQEPSFLVVDYGLGTLPVQFRTIK